MSNILTISENNQTLTTSETLVNVMMVSASTVATGVTSVNGDTGAVTVQETLVSGTNIKTINSESLLGSGNISITVSPEFLDSVFRIVDSTSGYKQIFDTGNLTANRTITYPDFDFDFNSWFSSGGDLTVARDSTSGVITLGTNGGAYIFRNGSNFVIKTNGQETFNFRSVETRFKSDNILGWTSGTVYASIDTSMSRTAEGIVGFNVSIDLSNAKSGTLASPPAGLVVGEVWSDTTDSATHPIARISTTTT